jgi:hypothetical protein
LLRRFNRRQQLFVLPISWRLTVMPGCYCPTQAFPGLTLWFESCWWIILGAAIGHTVDGWSLREAIMKTQIMLGIIVGVAVVATPVSFNAPRENQAIVTLNSAEAKVGQPLSATSVAGVNRRQGRREKRKSN